MCMYYVYTIYIYIYNKESAEIMATRLRKNRCEEPHVGGFDAR